MKCCKYTAGMLKEPVTFQRLTRRDDGAGGFTKEWDRITGAPTRAMVRPLSGSERWSSQRAEATANFRVVTRYTSNLSEGDRVVIRNRPGQISFIANVDFEDRWLEIDVNIGNAT